MKESLLLYGRKSAHLRRKITNLKKKNPQCSHHFIVSLPFHSWICREAQVAWGRCPLHSEAMFGAQQQGPFTEFVDSGSKWMFKVPSISEFDHRASLWAWFKRKEKKKDSKGSKGVKFSDERVLCFQGHDSYALRNEATLLVWMELHLKKTTRENNSVSVRGRPITWSSLPMCHGDIYKKRSTGNMIFLP